jgi:hypothetical protein
MSHWIVSGGGSAGWEYGLPPGLTAETWPRHRSNGLPLVHGFTVRVPERYRVRGADLVALSYLHPGESESYPVNERLKTRIQAILRGEAPSRIEADQPFFRALAAHARAQQPHTQWFTDLLQQTHAIVWHTEAELGGPRCPRPTDPLPAGLDPETMHLDEPVESAQPLMFVERAPEYLTIQFGPPLHWIQAEAEGFGELTLQINDGVGHANYGSGNCQIDLEHTLLDWAC